MAKTHTFRDNLGGKVEVFSDLKKDDELICIKEKMGYCDDGNIHVLFYDTLLTKGKIYKVHSISKVWHVKGGPYVMNDDGALTFASTEYFILASDYIDYEGKRYYYHYRSANENEICLGTENPQSYCNGIYRYSSKDPGNGLAFVVTSIEEITD